ncbi:MAG: hypothetical protein AB7E79_11670 [Rhodospirillaceae bacterium]
MRATRGVGNDVKSEAGTEVRWKNREGYRRRSHAGGNIAKHTLVRDGRSIGRDSVLELVNCERDLRQQENRRYPGEEPRAPTHAKHLKSSSARPRSSEK